MLRLLRLQLLPLNHGINPLKSCKPFHKSTNNPLEPQHRAPLDPILPQPRPIQHKRLKKVQQQRRRKQGLARPMEPFRTAREPRQRIVIKPRPWHYPVPRREERECHAAQPEDEDVECASRALVGGYADAADVQCGAGLAVHVDTLLTRFGVAFHGGRDGDCVGFAVGCLEGHGGETQVGQCWGTGSARGELRVVAEVVGQGVLVAGVEMRDDALLHCGIFGGLVCHCGGRVGG